MKNSYDYTKDEKYKSYEQFVYKSLIDLGFRITNVGTMYLKDLILFAYFNNYYEINITKIVNDYMSFKELNNISPRTFINCIDYSIKNSDSFMFNNTFQKTFEFNVSNYYISFKSILIMYINKLNN